MAEWCRVSPAFSWVPFHVENASYQCQELGCKTAAAMPWRKLPPVTRFKYAPSHPAMTTPRCDDGWKWMWVWLFQQKSWRMIHLTITSFSWVGGSCGKEGSGTFVPCDCSYTFYRLLFTGDVGSSYFPPHYGIFSFPRRRFAWWFIGMAEKTNDLCKRTTLP